MGLLWTTPYRPAVCAACWGRARARCRGVGRSHHRQTACLIGTRRSPSMPTSDHTPPTPSPASPDDLFEPYAKAVGFFLREWNELQEQLQGVFEYLLQDSRLAQSIWYTVQNDRLQRTMLLNAISARYNKSYPAKKPTASTRAKKVVHAAIYEDFWWIIDFANTLGQRRGASAHAPGCGYTFRPSRGHRQGVPPKPACVFFSR